MTLRSSQDTAPQAVCATYDVVYVVLHECCTAACHWCNTHRCLSHNNHTPAVYKPPYCFLAINQLVCCRAAGDVEMSFTAALHTYYKISSIDKVTVEGLSGVAYSDSLAGGQKVQQEGPVLFDKEVDRIYLAAPDSAIRVSLI